MGTRGIEDALPAYQDAFNDGASAALIALYEPNATFVAQPGQVSQGAAAIREALHSFLALKGRIERQDIGPNGIIPAGHVAFLSVRGRLLTRVPAASWFP